MTRPDVGDGVPCHPPAHAAAWAEAAVLEIRDNPRAYAWRPDRTVVVLGLGQEADRETRPAALAADGVPLLRRASGGGAVVLDEGTLCFGAVMPLAGLGPDRGLRAAFRVLTAHVVEVLVGYGLAVRVAGISDLAAPLRPGDPASPLVKVAGCAQVRKGRNVLVHGSLLVATDRRRFSRYLAFPSEPPDYRGERDHDAFCRTLAEWVDPPPTLEAIHDRIRRAACGAGYEWTVLPAEPTPAMRDLLDRKYAREAWNLRRKRGSQRQPSPES